MSDLIAIGINIITAVAALCPPILDKSDAKPATVVKKKQTARKPQITNHIHRLNRMP